MIDWYISDGTLWLRLPDGQEIKPTAKEVIGAEFKDRLSIRGQIISRKPSDAITTVQFSRFPPDILIRVYPPAADLSVAPRCEITLVLNNKNIAVLRSLDNAPDQIIVSGQWLPVIPDTIEDARQVLIRCGITEICNLTIRQYVRLLGLHADNVYFEQSLPAAIQSQKPEELSLPPTFQATLYPYQISGVRWLKRIVTEELGCILADEMGLGKTIQIIAILAAETSDGRSPSLVITTATLLENWRRELARFSPTLKTLVHRGQGRTGFPAVLKSHDTVLTTYDTALRDLSLFKMVQWNIVALDEAQSIKTPDAQRTDAVKQIPRRVGIAVTGTPVENKLRDLWSLMDFSVPGFLGSLSDFERTFDNSTYGASALEPLVSPLMLRRRVADVATDLPPRIDIPQPIELSDEAAARYDAIRAEIVAEYGASASLVSIIKLRLFCTHPFLVDDDSGDPLPYSTKYARMLEILDEIFSNNEKVLIFTSFTKMADILNSDISSRYGVPGSVLDGRTPVEDRQSTVDFFQKHTGSAFMVLNPKAAGVGLNITGANHVIHYNLEWNPAIEDQATARSYRRGQTRPVTVHRLFHTGTVEEIIDQRITHKRDIASTAVIGIQGQEDDVADIMRAIELSPVKRGG